MKFTRKRENFKCRNCGIEVLGSGYTNHCPKCLFSRHVDVAPGDRAEVCRGMMEPMGVEAKGGEYTIVHKCQNCGAVRRNKADEEDNFELILELSGRPATN